MADRVDHDRLFKELLTTFFAEFVELFLPDVSEYLDRRGIQFLDKEVFSDVTSGERLEADVVARARLKGEETFFLVHVENQAAPQAGFARRMFRYFARLHERHGLPVYPVALFSYDAPRRLEPGRYRVAFPGFVVNEFAFRVIQLNRLNWRDYVRQQNPVASALMAKMHIAPSERARVKLECLRLLATLRLNPANVKLISGFVDTYLRLDAAEASQFRRAVDALDPERREPVMEIVTSWMEQGLEQGRDREASLVLRMLRRHIGEVPAAAEQRVKGLSYDELDALGEALLDFRSQVDLDSWLRSRPT